MSLRFRLNALITLVFLIVLSAGIVSVIHNARNAVAEEVKSSADLSLSLLELVITTLSEAAEPYAVLLSELQQLEDTRHLHITFRSIDSQQPLVVLDPPSATDAIAPRWFVGLVRPPPMEFKRALGGQMPIGQILITADPSDEIDEAWEEARVALALLFAFSVLANGLVYFGIGQSLKPIDGILQGLDGIAKGDYAARLPEPDLPELGPIAEKVNEIAQALELSQQQNRYLAQQSLAIQEQERRNLALEMHDEMGQSLSAIKALAVSIEQQASVSDKTIASSARTIAQVSSRVYDVVRGMMSKLRPASLDELGLRTALEQLVDDWNAHHQDTFCNLATDGDFGGLSEQLNIGLYRIVQEGLTNVAKHSEGSEVGVQLSRGAGQTGNISLSISDNGKGMEPTQAPQGLGLLGIRERVESLEGTFNLTTQPGAGVSLEISVPVG